MIRPLTIYLPGIQSIQRQHIGFNTINRIMSPLYSVEGRPAEVVKHYQEAGNLPSD
jgi:hypothetical protein